MVIGGSPILWSGRDRASQVGLRGRPWARRKPRFWPIQQPEKLVQLDTKELRPARGVVLKQYSTRGIVSGWDVVEVHERATSVAAAHPSR